MGIKMVCSLVLMTFQLVFSAVVGAGDFTEPPVWFRGERWHYTSHLPGSDAIFYDLTWEVRDRGVIASRETEGGHIQLQYYTPNLEWLSLDGQTMDVYGRLKYEPVFKFEPAIPLYSWPLEAGKEWERCSENTVLPGGRHCNGFRVVRMEIVVVPAGSFKSAVIEHRQDGKLLSRRWYASEVKNVVKTERFVPYQNERLLMTIVLESTNVLALAMIDRGFAELCRGGEAMVIGIYDPDLGRCVSVAANLGE